MPTVGCSDGGLLAVVLGDWGITVRAMQQISEQAGPLAHLFADAQVEEIWWNDPGRVFVARGGRSELTPVAMHEDESRAVVERLLQFSGRRVDRSSPFVDAPLSDGSRLHVAIPPITARHWAVNIRRYVLRARSLADLEAASVVPAEAAALLREAVQQGRSLLIAGSTQAGKTTLLSALLGEVPASERVVSCEEVYELQLAHPDWAAMQTRSAGLEGDGEVPLRSLVRESLRMRPSRIVVGEVRQAEALDLLIAANSGMPTLSTIHANSTREAILKLSTLPLLAGPNINSEFVTAAIASSIDTVVHLRLRPDGSRAITEIAATTGLIEDGRPQLEVLWSASTRIEAA